MTAAIVSAMGYLQKQKSRYSLPRVHSYKIVNLSSL